MTVLHIAPHPDDETLGCGGTLLRHIADGDAVHWLLMTRPSTEHESVVRTVASAYGFAAVHRLDVTDARLDTVPFVELVDQIGALVRAIQPAVMYLPYAGDAHSDHRITFNAASACAKPFRYPSLRRVLAYETLSETNFGLDPSGIGFRPTLYVDVTPYLEGKLRILGAYDGTETGTHPFPRSAEVVRALAYLRGSEVGCVAAEAFTVLREVLR